VVFAVSLGILSGFEKPFRFANTPIVKYFIIAVVLLIAMHIVSVLPRLKKSYWLWDEANALYTMNSYKEANKSFQEAYSLYLDHNGIFLLNYAKSLYLSEDYNKALEMLKEGKQYYTDEVYFTTLGDTYKALDEYQKAEKAYWQAANLVPHKFYPLYLLAKLYDHTGNKKEVLQTVKQIMNKKVKVHSPAIEQIKEEMRQLKKKYQ
jgi:tetratricopeptide (TPR) repeat protein